MTVFRVTLSERHDRTQQQLFINFECDAPDVKTLARRLSEGEVVAGVRLWTRAVRGQPLLEITRRTPVALTRMGVARIDSAEGINFTEASG